MVSTVHSHGQGGLFGLGKFPIRRQTIWGVLSCGDGRLPSTFRGEQEWKIRFAHETFTIFIMRG